MFFVLKLGIAPETAPLAALLIFVDKDAGVYILESRGLGEAFFAMLVT